MKVNKYKVYFRHLFMDKKVDDILKEILIKVEPSKEELKNINESLSQFKGKDISKLTEKLLKDLKNVHLIHGSRDYFQIKDSKDFFIELIPVIKVNDPKKAENITDLSYSHVKYINRKIKSQKILNEIKIAKAFC